MRMVVVAKLQACAFGTAGNLAEGIALLLQVGQSCGHIHPGVHNIFHAGGLVVGDGLVPPAEILRAVARTKLVGSEIAGSMRRDGLHTGLVADFGEFRRFVAVEKAFVMVVAGSLQVGVAHLRERRQQVGKIAVILCAIVEESAHGIELQPYLFVARLRCGNR